VPVALEIAGLVEPTWRVGNGAVTSTSTMIMIGGHATTALLIAANMITIAVIGLFRERASRVSRRDAQRQVEIQAWHLRQLLPAAAVAP